MFFQRITGLDIEVAGEVARWIGVKLELLPNPSGLEHTWGEQTSGNWYGAYGALIESMTPTAKRNLNLNFPVIAVRAAYRNDTAINVRADASGKRTGVMKAANHEMYVRLEHLVVIGMEPPIQKIGDPAVLACDGGTGPYDALENGDIDAFILYQPTIMRLVQEGRPNRVIVAPLYRVPQGSPSNRVTGSLPRTSNSLSTACTGTARSAAFP